MATNISTHPNDAQHIRQAEQARIQSSEPNWLSRIFSRKSRSKQKDKDVQADRRTTGHKDEPVTTPVVAPESIKDKDTSLKPEPHRIKRRFSFSSAKAKVNAAQPLNKKLSTPTLRNATSAAYIPRHAGSDFGKIPVPATHRDSAVLLYSGSVSSRHQQQRRPQSQKSEPGTRKTAANVAVPIITVASIQEPGNDLGRTLSSATDTASADGSSYVVGDTAPLTSLAHTVSGKRLGSATPSQSRSRESLRPARTATSLPPVPKITYYDADSANNEGASVCPSGQEDGKPLSKLDEQSSSSTLPDQNKKKTLHLTSHTQHPASDNGLQTPLPQIAAASSLSCVSLPSLATHPGNLGANQYRRRASRQTLNSDYRRGEKKHKQSRMVGLGLKVSEYIKPTNMPDRMPAMPPISAVTVNDP